MAELTDVELLSRLHVALAPAPARPDEASLARLHATLAELDAEIEPVNIATARRRHGRVRSGVSRRMSTRVAAASVLAFTLTAGVAAAAVATDTLPGPTRAFAYDLGLPVTSPGLHSAQQSAAALHQSILSHNVAQQSVLGQQLITELKTLNASDLSQDPRDRRHTVGRCRSHSADVCEHQRIVDYANGHDAIGPGAIGLGATVSVPGPAPTLTTPTCHRPQCDDTECEVPTVTTPVVTVPTVTVPGVSIPKVTVPSIPLPVVTIPIVHLPGLP